MDTMRSPNIRSNKKSSVSKNKNISYDKLGRMRYHPDFHPNQGKTWLLKDQQFLIEYYEKLGPDEISLVLGRTIHSVMMRASDLRKKGLMPKRTITKNFKRTRTIK